MIKIAKKNVGLCYKVFTMLTYIVHMNEFKVFRVLVIKLKN